MEHGGSHEVDANVLGGLLHRPGWARGRSVEAGRHRTRGARLDGDRCCDRDRDRLHSGGLRQREQGDSRDRSKTLTEGVPRGADASEAARTVETGEIDMATGKADELKGRVKEAAGALTDDPRLKREGQLDQTIGKVKQAAEKMIDKVKDAAK